MSNNFENLKNTILNFISNKEKNNKPAKLRKDFEESSLLLEYNDKALIKYSEDIESKKIPFTLITSAKRIPFLFGSFGMLLIVTMILLSFSDKMNEEEFKLLYMESGKSRTKFLNFFRLPLVNVTVYHLINSTYSLTGIALLSCLFQILYSKLIDKTASGIEYIKLYMTISFGMISQIINLIYGTVYTSSGIEKINENFTNEMRISIFQFVFLIQIFFSILFGIFTTIFIAKLKTKPSYSLENQEIPDAQNNSSHNKWFNYKLISVIYLAFFSLAYIFVYLHNNNIILKDINSELMKENYSYLLAVFPYFLYFNNLILYLMFYDEMRDSNIYISQPEEEGEYFEKRERNIL